MQLLSPQKISQKNKIPPAIIGLLPPMFAHHYTHNELDDLFIASFAPPEIPVGSKPEKVKAWLRAINMKCNEPLEVLGNLLGDFLEKEYYDPDPSGLNPSLYEKILQLQKDKRKVLETLKKDGLEYQRGGHLIKKELTSIQELQKSGLLSTEELQKRIAAKGLSAVEIEVKRALENIEKDPGGQFYLQQIYWKPLAKLISTTILSHMKKTPVISCLLYGKKSLRKLRSIPKI
ncbi:hypothetical protein [Bartonella sp. LB28NMGDW]|uniref:hypothetical protein n=1 Tax=Bartonella sp. LB28NMGDW TaxID=3243549 RepID=UPI0035CF6987